MSALNTPCPRSVGWSSEMKCHGVVSEQPAKPGPAVKPYRKLVYFVEENIHTPCLKLSGSPNNGILIR